MARRPAHQRWTGARCPKLPIRLPQLLGTLALVICPLIHAAVSHRAASWACQLGQIDWVRTQACLVTDLALGMDSKPAEYSDIANAQPSLADNPWSRSSVPECGEGSLLDCAPARVRAELFIACAYSRPREDACGMNGDLFSAKVCRFCTCGTGSGCQGTRCLRLRCCQYMCAVSVVDALY